MNVQELELTSIEQYKLNINRMRHFLNDPCEMNNGCVSTFNVFLLNGLPIQNSHLFLTYTPQMINQYQFQYFTCWQNMQTLNSVLGNTSPYEDCILSCDSDRSEIKNQNVFILKSHLSKKQFRNDCVKIPKSSITHQLKEEAISKSGSDRFIKKNTQSNIVNQIFSFMWSPEKSKNYLEKILDSDVKIDSFYATMKSVKTNCKSQLNRVFLKQLTDSQLWEKGFCKLRKKLRNSEHLSDKQLSEAICRLSFYYLRLLNRNSIMTSNRMSQVLWDLHFKKCHQIQNFLYC